MSHMSTATADELGEITAPRRFWDRQRRLGAALVLIGLVATVVFGALAPSATARFTLSENAQGAALSINGRFGAILFGLVAIAAGAALLTGVAKKWQTTLLGRNRPWGTLLAAILFGALRAGGNRMQSFTGISVELVTVLQALIVIFIAAPALVKTIFHLRAARAARLGASMAKGW